MDKNEKKKAKLTNQKHINFCHEYILTLDAPGSYMKFNPKCTPKSAPAAASRLLKNPLIIEYINETIRDNASQLGRDPERIMMELEKMAYSNDNKYPAVKLAAIKMLGQSVGLFTDKIQIENKDIAVRLED